MRLPSIHNVRGFLSDYYLTTMSGGGRGPSSQRQDFAYHKLRRIRERAEGRAADASAFRELFARPLLRDVFGFHLGAGSDHLYRLYDSAQTEAAGGRELMLLWVGSWDDELDAGRGAAQPMRLVGEAVAGSGLRYGLLLNGDRLRLVRAPGDGPRNAWIEADLEGLAARDDRESFLVAWRLFSAASFLRREDGSTFIEEVERESRLHASRVSEDLRLAVLASAEALMSGLLRDARTRGRICEPALLERSELVRYRDASLLALYRILFILYAEARDPRLDGHELYRKSYSAQGLLDEILGSPERSWPANRCSFWERLRCLFRIYDRGLPPLTPWVHIPPRGGDFFSAATTEGALLDESRLGDDVVASLMLDLATTAPKAGIGRERVSFQELDIESLGSVYEGILEYEPRVARETVIEVKVQGRSLALGATDLVRLCELKGLSISGDPALVEGTAAGALHPVSVVEDTREVADENADTTDGEEAVDGEEDEAEEPKRGAVAGLLRRLERNSFYFVPGPGRKGTGSFYTPRPLVQDIVAHALGPLVEGKRSSGIEALRVLDPACGSAHFLVEAMRYLGQALHHALSQEYPGTEPPGFRSTTGQPWDANWQSSDQDARLANSEARAWCKRRIAERCLFGVDINPTAVQLARVALWIESVAGDRPLTYFEHHVRCGNSLAGTWLDRMDHPPSGESRGEVHPGLFAASAREAIVKAAARRAAIDGAPVEDLEREGVEPESIGELDYKEHLRREADEGLAAARLLFDMRSASVFVPAIWKEWEVLCGLAESSGRLERHARGRPWWPGFEETRRRERFFHWELEFPEVFRDPDRSGFDAVLGNPPWDKVLPARTDFYARSDILIRAFKGADLDRRIRELHAAQPGLQEEFEGYRDRTRAFAESLRRSGDFPLSQARSGAAHEDLSKYFLDRAVRLARRGGMIGMVVPSVFYNGDGCVGLRKYMIGEATIERFYGFENHEKIFPIDSRYKFVDLVARKEATEKSEIGLAFMRRDLGELEETATWRTSVASRKKEAPWIVRMDRREIGELSPDTSAFLEFRGPEDLGIIRKMYAGGVRLGSDGPGSWGIRLFTDQAHMQIYNITRDKDLWTNPSTRKLFSPASVLGKAPADTVETIRRMRSKGFWPVYEGKHVEQFLVGIKPFRWWLSVELAERKYGRPPRAEPTLVLRETASNTNERTCIAAVLPECSAASHKLTGVILSGATPETLACVLNSFTFDYALRLRTAGTSVSFTYLKPMPIPAAIDLRQIPLITTRLAWQTRQGHISEDRSLWPALWETNQRVAEAYGLDSDDLERILATFPGFARKRPEFHAYLLQQLAAWRETTR